MNLRRSSKNRLSRFLVLASLVCAATAIFAAQAPPAAIPPPSPAATQAASVEAASARDRQRMLALLGLNEDALRPRPDGDPASPHATNYDPSKANLYPNLPDPLLTNDGRPVTTPAQWWSVRRPEIVAAFEHAILGRAPASLPQVTWQVVRTTHQNYGGVPAVVTQLTGRVDNSADPQIAVNIGLVLIVPAHASGPVPVLLEIAFDKDYADAEAGRIDSAPPSTSGHWGVNGGLVLQKGWGFAVLSPTSVQADNGAGLTAGIIGLVNKGQPRSLDDWGALRAWAWGASRALDYLAANPAVDAKQVGLVGHSRFGKAALVAMAFDPRFAIAYSSSSGEGGAKLYRHIFGEQLSNVAGPSLYHWFNGNFLRYAGPLNPGDLPVDNHELLALSAPRPVFIGGGAGIGDGYANPNGDAWADPEGMFLAELAASPVYQLLGVQGIESDRFPPTGAALVRGNLAFRQHPYGHTPAPNWPAFLDYASRYLHTAATKP